MTQVKRLVMVTPFDKSIISLSDAEQLVLLKGCVLCQITRDVANGRTQTKPEWKTCRAEIGVRIDVVTADVAEAAVLEAIGHEPPAVCAETNDGRFVELLGASALARCNGSVSDFRGRLSFRLASLGYEVSSTKDM